MAPNRFRGKKQFLLKLDRLKPEIRREIEAVTETNARAHNALSAQFAPMDEGTLKADHHVESYTRGTFIRWRSVAGSDDRAFYARHVEFLRQAYFFPAYRALRRSFARRLSRGFRKAIKRVFR